MQDMEDWSRHNREKIADDLIAKLRAENERLAAKLTFALNYESGLAKLRGEENARLRALLKYLLYNDNGCWRVGIKPDTDVTSIVGDLLGEQAKG
jgi:hypothetical protein